MFFKNSEVDASNKSHFYIFPDLETTFEELPESRKVVAGNRIVIPCRPPESDPPAQNTWYFNANPVELNTEPSPITISNSGSLEFSAVQLDHQGSYTCVATNEDSLLKSVSTPPIQLTVDG